MITTTAINDQTITPILLRSIFNRGHVSVDPTLDVIMSTDFFNPDESIGQTTIYHRLLYNLVDHYDDTIRFYPSVAALAPLKYPDVIYDDIVMSPQDTSSSFEEIISYLKQKSSKMGNPNVILFKNIISKPFGMDLYIECIKVSMALYNFSLIKGNPNANFDLAALGIELS